MISEKSSSGRATLGQKLIDILSPAVRPETTAAMVSRFPSALSVLPLALSARRAAYSERASDLGHERHMSFVRTALRIRQTNKNQDVKKMNNIAKERKKKRARTMRRSSHFA